MSLPLAPAALQRIERLESQGARVVVEHLGRAMVWHRFGEGPPLLLVHGGHGDWTHWLCNIEALAPYHTLWLPDLPGFGASDELHGHPHAQDRMQQLVAALHATLDLLVGMDTTIDIAAFSFGALVCAELAALRTPRRLALLGPAGHGRARRQTATLRDWRLGEPAQRMTVLQENLRSQMLFDPAAADAIATSLYALQCQATRFRSKSISRSGGLQAALERYRGPLMLVWGEHDLTTVPTEMAALLSEGRAHCRCEIVPGAGHWVQYEKADTVSALLLAWFGDGIGA